MTVVKEERNSKRMFFGGGKGSLIPFRPRSQSHSPESSDSAVWTADNERIFQESIKQIFLEAEEQFNAPYDQTEESGLPTTKEDDDG